MCKTGGKSSLLLNCAHKKRQIPVWYLPNLAEEEGFEPPDPFGSTVFKTVAISRSATPPGVTPRQKTAEIGTYNKYRQRRQEAVIKENRNSPEPNHSKSQKLILQLLTPIIPAKQYSSKNVNLSENKYIPKHMCCGRKSVKSSHAFCSK